MFVCTGVLDAERVHHRNGEESPEWGKLAARGQVGGGGMCATGVGAPSCTGEKPLCGDGVVIVR